MDDSKPIFIQLAETIEDEILAGTLPEESQVPSTNEFAQFYRINPATAGKGVNLLVEEGILYKKRGIGMFVAAGARAVIGLKRKEQFREQFVTPLLEEAKKLGIDRAQILDLITKENDQ